MSLSKGQLVYLDESGIDMNICQDKGWSEIGKILLGKKSGKYYQRTNILSALNNNNSIAPFIFTGTCNTISLI